MQRDKYIAVTELPVLVPCAAREQEGSATFLGELGLHPVRAFTDSDLTPQSKRNPLRTMLESEQEFFAAIVGLQHALEMKDRLAATRAREKLTTAIARKERVVLDPDHVRQLAAFPGVKPERAEMMALELYTLRPGEEDERVLLSVRVSEALASVRLVLWWSGSQFRPALYCPDLNSALYTFVLMKTVAGQSWGVCPFCGLLFVKSRRNQDYCSIAHREAHRVARWRAAKVSKSKKKGGKNVTRKTR
jgi:hypothetical protein